MTDNTIHPEHRLGRLVEFALNTAVLDNEWLASAVQSFPDDYKDTAAVEQAIESYIVDELAKICNNTGR